MPPQLSRSWHSFENLVAAIFRSLGAAKVKQNVDLAGNQIDVYVEESTPAGQLVRTAVECKYHSRPLSKDSVLQFGLVARFLRQGSLIDKAVIVAYAGFTQAATITAEAAGIELLSLAELEARLGTEAELAVAVKPFKYGPQVGPLLTRLFDEAERTPIPPSFPDTAFVAMPFAEDLEDLYLYGIRKCVQELGLRCKRADEIDHAGPVMQEILDYIRRSRVIIAELSDRNPNVFYEVGWAHALERPTVLVSREGTDLPFDVRHINILHYRSIHQLEERLRERLRAVVSSAT